MRLAGRITTISLAAALSILLLGGASPARAQSPQPAAAGTTDRAALIAERARVRAQLDRVSAEIDALKRAGAQSPLGMRDDYRLRARLADAEALARRLTEIDARLGTPARPATAETGVAVAPAPTVSATDGPAEIEAKADILADQARRVSVEAEVLSRRAGQLKARRELRRRAGQLEHDPFSPLEGPRVRNIPVGASSSGGGAGNFGAPQAPGGPVNVNGSVATSGDRAGSAPVVGGAGAAAANTQTGGGGSPHALVAPSAPPSPTTGASGTDAGSLSAQLRDLLDPATLAEIRRLEASAAPGATVEALERAAAALRARAGRLNGQSQALRARAHAH